MGKYRCAVFKEQGAPLEIEEREIPSPGRGEVLLKVQACGMCHSDCYVQYGAMGTVFPRVPGHEVAAVIEQTGEQVSERWQKGMRVGVGWYSGNCGNCDPCRRGNFNHCQEGKISGISYDGGYGEYMIASQHALASIPDELSATRAATLLCAGVTTFNSLRNSGVRAGDLVVVHGIGGLGHLGVQFAARMGCRTIAVARGEDKRALALQLGAHQYIDSTKEDAVKSIKEMGGAKVVLATATSSKAMSEIANCLGFDGTMVVLGADQEPLSISPLLLIANRATIRGWPSGAACDSEDTMRFSALTGVEPMIEVVSLDQVAEGYAKMMKGEARFRMVIQHQHN